MPTLPKIGSNRKKNNLCQRLPEPSQQSALASVTDMLVKLSWDGKMIAIFGLELLPDNRRVFRSMFSEEEFCFTNGATASDLLPCEIYKHHYMKHKQIIFSTLYSL
jgi:hypothetical protein